MTLHQTSSLTLGTATNGSASFPLAIDAATRARHVYVIGQTGTGKTNLLQNLAAQDLKNNNGIAFIDPHGDAARQLIAHIPRHRADQFVYLDCSDIRHPLGINFTTDIPRDKRPTAAENLVSAFVYIWGKEAIGNRSQQLLRNALRVLMDTGNTMLAIPKLLMASEYRNQLLQQVGDRWVRDYWTMQYDGYTPTKRDDVISPILNKLDAFMSIPAIRNILAQPKNTIDIRKIMDRGHILVVNLSKGQLGEAPAYLLGCLLVTAIAQAALSRDDMPEEQRNPFYLYADEFQSFAADSFSLILSEARKYKLAVTVANQFTGALPDTLQHAVFGNVGTWISFRVGADDAPLLAKHFNYESSKAFQELSNFTALIRPLVNGTPGNVVRLDTHAPRKPLHTHSEELIEQSRRQFSRDRREIEKAINRFLSYA